MDQSEQILSLKLLNYRNRPFYAYSRNGEDITALFDSGAVTPVWCMGDNKLKRAYPEVINKEEKCFISGFGKEAVSGKVYVIPVFELIGEYCVYRVRNLQIAVCQNPSIGCDFVMSDTMFSKADTTIRRRNGKQLEIVYDREEYFCTPRYSADKTKFTVSVWSQS